MVMNMDQVSFSDGAQRPSAAFDPQVDHRDAVETTA
jgi:hypothetical protein